MNAQKCPGCNQSKIIKLEGQRAVCRSCSITKRRLFFVCWACQREWSREASTTNICVLPNCSLRDVLLSAHQIDDSYSSARGCPYFRACPGCKALITHSGYGCPNIVCPHCPQTFCFRCMRPYCYNWKQCVIKNNNEILEELGL